MKKTTLYISTLLISLSLHGCVGVFSVAATAFSVITTSQEIEEEYDGSISDYVEDKMETTYEYIEGKVSTQEDEDLK